MDEQASAVTSEAHEGDLADAALKTYRYVRLSLIVLVAALASSVVLERAHAKHLQDSISAYYYTPTHSIFVATFVGMGICLIALKGSNDTEDLLLNIGGILAPIVALVPTTEPSNIYGSKALTITKARTLIGNNVIAILIAGVIALGIAYAADKSNAARSTAPKLRMPDKWGLAVTAALIIIGSGLYWKRRDFFLKHAHTASAIAMALILASVVVFNALRANSRDRRKYRNFYWIAVGIMALGAVPVIVHLASSDFKPWNFALESIVMGGFTTFWIMQTFELWDIGVDPVPVSEVLPGAQARRLRAASNAS